jgi:predicted ATPase
VCERVGGLPLAIELAAGRLGLLDPAGLATRLADSLSLLDDARDAPARHRTLRATLDWSFDLLDDEERDAFTALGAFAGGCELDAAELASGSVLPVLEALVAKRLVTARAGRLTMLEPVRQYAAYRLAARLDADDVRPARRALRRSAERAEPELWTRGRSTSEFDRLRRELDSVRAAVGWCFDRGRTLDALALAGGLGSYGRLTRAGNEVRR